MTEAEKLNDLKNFSNCETIIGNIILANISDANGTKLMFFNSVRKITGYLAIMDCDFPHLPFRNLKIISGQYRIPESGQHKYALFVSKILNASFVGLDNLNEISQGSVLFEENNHHITGFANTIHWDDILMDGTATVRPREDDTPHPDQCEFYSSQGGRHSSS